MNRFVAGQRIFARNEIKPVYHHIYDFGTVSLFLAFGAKEFSRVLDRGGNMVLKKYIPIKAVNDERICDGHYYAKAIPNR